MQLEFNKNNLKNRIYQEYHFINCSTVWDLGSVNRKGTRTTLNHIVTSKDNVKYKKVKIFLVSEHVTMNPLKKER